MDRRKKLKELTLKDNFMFGAVMSDETNCRRLLELVLQFPIERVEVSKEKSIVFHPQYYLEYTVLFFRMRIISSQKISRFACRAK